MAMQSPALLTLILLQLGLDAPILSAWEFDTDECYRHVLQLLQWLLCVTAQQLAAAPASACWLCFLLERELIFFWGQLCPQRAFLSRIQVQYI